VCNSVWWCVAVSCIVLQCAAVCCSVLQCVAVCCSVVQCVQCLLVATSERIKQVTPQHTATHCNILQHPATHCNSRPKVVGGALSIKMQHTATHCNTLQHTAPNCTILQHQAEAHWRGILDNTAIHCNTLQHTATHCNTLQHTATHCNTLQHTAPYCNTRLKLVGGVFSMIKINSFEIQCPRPGPPQPRVRHCYSMIQRVAVVLRLCCGCVLQCVAVCCSMS